MLTPYGYIATNYHALQGADGVEMRYFPEPGISEDYRSFNTVKLLYADPERDIAIVKVNSNSLPFLECPAGSGCQAHVGEKAYAIGNPEGLSHTISEGIVSAVRSIDNQDVIQHTAAISHGSSGGALVDSDGGLLGMNSWQVADGQNLNFAIPSKYVFEALSAAHHATAALNWPAEATDDGTNGIEDRAERALQSRDYVQAANQAELAIKSGISNSKIYMILGAARKAQGENEEAEKYLRQSVLLSSPDDKYKQTSRALLLEILEDRFKAHPASVDRLLFIKLIADFLGSNSPMEEAESYDQKRAWAASLSKSVRSIAGRWRDKSDRESLLSSAWPPCGGYEYEIAEKADGYYELALESKPAPTDSSEYSATCNIALTQIAKSSGGTFGAALSRLVMVHSPSTFGAVSQGLRVEFTLSDDLMAIEGVATAGAMERVGPLGKFIAGMLQHGPQQWRFVLQRVD